MARKAAKVGFRSATGQTNGQSQGTNGAAGKRGKGPQSVAQLACANIIMLSSLGLGMWVIVRKPRKATAPEPPPLELRKLVRCGEICDLGISGEDKDFAEGARKHKGASLDSDHTEDLIKVCMWRCQEGHKEASETHGVASVDHYTEMPTAFRNFVDTAQQCVSAGFRTSSDIVAGLEQCGVVHVEDAVPTELLSQVREAYGSIRADAAEDQLRTDSGNLRGGRLETWLPFRAPFNDTRLIQLPKTISAIKAYLGSEAVLDHVSVITATGEAALEPQKPHADVGVVRKHLEVHLPLVDVSPQMGPTVFCPASHGLAQKGRAGWTSGVERALSSWYLTPTARCAEDSSLSYARPLKIGQMTIYDANVFHGGTANSAGVERPVLQLSYSTSPAATSERDYLKSSFKANSEAKDLALGSSHSFRTAFLNQP